MIENTCEDFETRKPGNRKNRWWSVLSCGWTLAGLLLASNAHSQTDEMDRAAELSIEELITIGGRPVGPWPLGGLTWPLEELHQRPRDEVIEAAIECLENPAPQQNSHSFCVYMLRSWNVADRYQIFVDTFDAMNHLGQFEVLLQGYYANDRRYDELFAIAVQDSMEMPPPNRVATLASLYAAHAHYLPLLTALTAYHQRHRDAIEEYPNSVGLNGFPYSDVVTLSVDDVEEAFSRALAFGTDMTSIAGTPMTPEEQNRLNELRATILEPPRVNLPMRTRTLTELIDALGDAFPGQSFTLADPAGRLASLPTEIGGNRLSAPDMLATLCNEYSLEVDYGGYPRGWRAGDISTFRDLRVRNNCLAEDSFLITLSVRGRPGDRFYASAELHSPATWPRFRQTHFSLQDVTLADGTQTDNPDASSIISLLGRALLPLPDRDIDTMPPINVRGTVSIGIPEEVRILEQPVAPGMERLDLEYGPFRLEAVREEGALQVHWGVPRSCCQHRSTRATPTYNSGMVTILDESGDIITQRGATRDHGPGYNTVYDHETLKNNIHINERQLFLTPPARLIWTMIPEMETLRLDVEFTNVRLDEPAQP